MGGASSIWGSRFCSHLNNETQRKRTNIQNGWICLCMYALHIMDKVTDDLSYVESIMKFSFKWRPFSRLCYRAGFSFFALAIVRWMLLLYGSKIRRITTHTYRQFIRWLSFGPDSFFSEEALMKITTAKWKIYSRGCFPFSVFRVCVLVNELMWQIRSNKSFVVQ